MTLTAIYLVPIILYILYSLSSGLGCVPVFALVTGLSLVCWAFMASSDPYGLFHLTLNKLPGEEPSISPRTEWLNMGYWKDTNVFPDACKALAINLVQAARCQDGGNVLDVGHGTGESLILLLSDPSSRPSTLTGITSLPAHHQRSQDRVAAYLQSSSYRGPKPRVTLYACDAIHQPGILEHPLRPSSDTHFDTILALDCAYHFNTRETFLVQSFSRLAPHGRIALADICFAPGSLESRRTRLITSVLRLMPKHNMVSTEDYVSQMREIGYVDIVLEDITEDVFPGFVKFLKGRGWGWWVFGAVIETYARVGARFIVVSGSKGVL